MSREADDGPVTVLQLADYGGPYAGSFVPMLRALAHQVRARGWDFECAFPPSSRDRPWLADLAADRIPVSFAGGGSRSELNALIDARLEALEGAVIMHTHFTAFDLGAAAAARRNVEHTTIWHVHSFLPRQPVKVARALIKYGWIARSVVRIVCVSDHAAAAVRRRGAFRGRIEVVPNGIDCERFRRIGPDERIEARRALDLPESQPVLLHFAWNWAAKGGPLFSETLSRLRGAGLPAIGVSVGGGDEAKDAARRLGLGEGLRIVDPDADVRRFFAATDAFFASSHGEGGRPPFAVLEALSCGIPVVATDIPGHRVDGGPAALRCAPANANRLAALARDVLTRDSIASEHEAAEAHHWVSTHRDLAAAARAVAAIYEAVLGEL